MALEASEPTCPKYCREIPIVALVEDRGRHWTQVGVWGERNAYKRLLYDTVYMAIMAEGEKKAYSQ